MKTAQAQDGTEVIASNEAPIEAICPYCKGIVILRKRKLMNNGGYVYFWRHRDNKNRNCPGRSRRG
ncbi:MAG: hypothetical protein ACK2UN_03165 [Candidatus Promineifilaceae bacterium]